MTVSKCTLWFSLLAFVGYQAGFSVAYKLFPSVLTLVIFPPWMAAIGFAFISLPVAYIHAALVMYVRRPESNWNSLTVIAVSTCVKLAPGLLMYTLFLFIKMTFT